jgi:TATA-box binding protein (TBP) (component of TFIID and TFIIIB)
MSEFEVVNVVGTIDFQQRIALSPLADSLAERDEVNDVDYDPSELHLIHSWLFEDDIYVAFYKNGTCAVTGAGSLDKFYEVSDAVGDVVEDILDFEIETTVNLSNIVRRDECDLVRLSKLNAPLLNFSLWDFYCVRIVLHTS